METQKFTQEEIQQIQQIQSTAAAIFNTIGQLHFQRKSIESQIEQAEMNHSQLIERETELIATLRERYGDGSLDLNTFEFVPTKQ